MCKGGYWVKNILLACLHYQASFVVSIYLSVLFHVPARVPLDGFPWNLVLGTFMKYCMKKGSWTHLKWCWGRMLKIKLTDRIKNDEVFQRAKEERLLLNIKKRRHLWIGRTIRQNEFVVNILEEAITGKRAVGRPRLQYLKQVARNTSWQLYSNEKNGLQQFQLESCQPIKRLKDKKKMKNCREPNLVNVGQKYRTLCVETKYTLFNVFMLLTVTCT